MSSILIKNGTIINEGRIFRGDILVIDDQIKAIGNTEPETIPPATKNIDASGCYVIPGIIDDQVHFRDPGLTHKADIFSETAAAVAGGITSFMDMPNTVPQTITVNLLEEKYKIGAGKSLINFSFYIGGTNTNLDELLKTDPETVCGIKLFLGSSTGNMLVNDEKVLREIFRRSGMLIACHCEDEPTVRRNADIYRAKYGENVPVKFHPLIRSREACFITSSYAAALAGEFNSRLHILHLSTADELKLFSSKSPVSEKRMTGEVCVHHLWFEESDYEMLGNKIKWNPAIKTIYDRNALVDGVNSDLIDIIATDHAPHTLAEKSESYFKAPSGGPLVQHSLLVMLELNRKNRISLEKIVEKMCHNPAIIYRIRQRGFIREGYKADLCIFSRSQPWTVTCENLLYKCGWSPFEGFSFCNVVKYTIVNGNIVYDNGKIDMDHRGERLLFNSK
ncbi:MAG TPA: dihydroorotase [Bacteroidales bacterium]|nr:dihydroorotase [Bacteroidales bacterium]